MDIKLKKRKPWVTFFCFFTALTLAAASSAWIFSMFQSGLAVEDYKLSRQFADTRAALLLAARYETGEITEYGAPALESERENIAYYIEDGDSPHTGNTAARTIDEFAEDIKRQINEGGYDYLLVARDGHATETMRVRGEVRTREFFPPQSVRLETEFAGEAPPAAIAIRPVGALKNYGRVYSAYYGWYGVTVTVLVMAGVFALCLLILLIVFCKRQSLRLATNQLAALMGRIWMEPKLLLTAVAAVALWNVLDIPSNHMECLLTLLACFWWLWLLLVDLRANGGRFFTQNIAASVMRLMKSLESDYDFLHRMKRRPVILAGAELVLAAALIWLWAAAAFDDNLFVAVFMLPVGALAVFLLVRYLREYNRNMDEFARVIDYADEIRDGAAETPLVLEGDFAPLAENLNGIRDGISQAVEEQVRSEKMKVELVSNVSHDLKTPLTSIINYVDLLGRERLQPEFANDYVKILEQKAARLKNLVQDLFEISKANSGALDLYREQLDVVALMEQTIAEMDARADQAGVEIKTQFSVSRLIVCADGKKLHRVFENLLGNALKYALAGTRVYLSVRRQGELAEVAFKNVSNYEMTFSVEDIMERFQRGDSSRATEGSGLGLAIAKSFVELNGGKLGIELDGDLFKAIVTLPVNTQEPPAEPRETADTPPETEPEQETTPAPEAAREQTTEESPEPDAGEV